MAMMILKKVGNLLYGLAEVIVAFLILMSIFKDAIPDNWSEATLLGTILWFGVIMKGLYHLYVGGMSYAQVTIPTWTMVYCIVCEAAAPIWRIAMWSDDPNRLHSDPTTEAGMFICLIIIFSPFWIAVVAQVGYYGHKYLLRGRVSVASDRDII